MTMRDEELKDYSLGEGNSFVCICLGRNGDKGKA